MISPPFGRHAWMLLAMLPGIWLIARRLLLGIPRPQANLLSPVLACVLLVLATHIASLATHSFYRGFTIAAMMLGVCGYLTLHPRLAAAKVESGQPARRLPLSFWLLLIVTAIFFARPIFAYNFFDEATVPGHQATPSALLNGYYPPVYLAQPTIELRYHYGFDLVVAVTQLLLHVRVDQANDLLTLAAWMMCVAALWALGEEVIGPGAGFATALIVPFAGGLTFFGQLALRRTLWTGPFRINGVPMLYPFSFNFFQKPWSLGLPAWCLAVVLIVHCAKSRRRPWPLLVALAAVVAGLAQLEAVLFVSLVAASGITLLPRFLWKRELRVFETGAAVLIGALLATQLHGFFAMEHLQPSENLVSSVATGGIAGGWWNSLRWNFLSFCLLLPLGVLGLRHVRSLGMFSATALLALVICNTCRYPYTTDINKFASLAAIPLAIGAAAILHRWWGASHRGIFKAGVFLLGGIVMLQGCMFIAAHWVGRGLELRTAIHPYLSAAYPIDADDAAAISFLRGKVRPPENVYCRREENLALHYSMWGGLPVIWSQDWDAAFGMTNAVHQQRFELAVLSDRATMTASPQRDAVVDELISQLRQQGVVWMVVHDADNWLLPVMEVRAARGEAQAVAQFGAVRVYHFR